MRIKMKHSIFTPFPMLLAAGFLCSCATNETEQKAETQPEVSYLSAYNNLLPGMDLSASLTDETGQTGLWSGVDGQNIELMDTVARDIERIRKGDFALTLVDANGLRINASVEIEHVGHEFKFGANAWEFSERPEAFANSTEAIERLFNAANVCNYLQEWWRNQEEPYGNWGKVRKEMEWCADLGLKPRFHIIQYVHMRKPGWWLDLNTEEVLWDFYTKRVADVAQEFEGEFFEYDVMNEMVHWPYWFEKYHQAEYGMPNYFAFDWMRDPENGARVVRQAREYLPNAKLVVLETGVWNTHPDNIFAQEIHDYYERLIELEAPFDMIGYQGRYEGNGVQSVRTGKADAGERMYYMESIDSGLEWFAGLGKEMGVTEFAMPSRRFDAKSGELKPADFGADRKELALWVANFHILAFSKPYINQVTWWSIFRNPMRFGDAGLINLDGSLTETGQAMDTLINERWHTQLEREVKKGQLNFRGFYGDYLVKVEGYAPQTIRLYRGDNRTQKVSLQ
jgi:GH35 family endo-1,4-beta-xylanase